MKDPLRGVTDKKCREVLRAAMNDGCEVTWTKGGHIRVMTPNGPYFTGGTPSGGAARNLRSGLRGKGVNIP